MEKSARVHHTAIVDPSAKLAHDVTVAPYVIIHAGVEIGPGTKILEHTVLDGSTVIGSNCRIGPGAYVGMPPQHLRFKDDPGNPSYLIVGDGVTIREGARVHRATKPGKENATRIGDRCFLMGAIHVAHDCVLGSDVIMADGALLGGHCEIGANAFLGGGCTLHQFTRVGRYAIISGNEAISQDVPPFAAARYGRLKGYNAVACKRAGFSREVIGSIRSTYYRLRHHRVIGDALAAIRHDFSGSLEAIEIVDFIAASKRGIMPSRWRTAVQANLSENDD
jgi:UDP-N-acetylglucosamine acyltransferase